jgi:hypothetical protein
MWCWRGLQKIDRVKNLVVWPRVKERNILYTIKRRKGNWIGYSLCRNCPLKHAIEGRIGRTDRRDGKTRKKMQAATGWPSGKDRILGIERESTKLQCLDNSLRKRL